LVQAKEATMSNPDSFIEEVSEDLRRDKLFAVFRRYGWIAALAVIGIVGTAAFTEWTRAQDRAEAQAYGDAIFAALNTQDANARVDALASISAPEDGAPILALLTAAEATAADETDRALAALRSLADDPLTPTVYRDLANLRLLLLGGEALGIEDRLARIEALSAPGAPFRQIAREQQALVMIEQGETDSAIELLTDIAEDATSTNGQRQRAAQLVVSLGGSFEDIEIEGASQ
jgi:hypothetical protein